MITLALAQFDFWKGLVFHMNLIILMITLALAQFDFLKDLSVSHESYNSDDYFGTCSV
jgi:hypothetical protein